MKKRSRYRIAILMALVPLAVLLFVSCSATPEKISLDEETAGKWNAAVDKHIAQPQRAAKLKALGQQLVDVSNSLQQDIGAFNENAMLLNERYDASHMELQQLVVAFSAQRKPKLAEYRDIIFAMRSEVSADEWKALND